MAAVAVVSMSIGGVAFAESASAGKPSWAGKPVSMAKPPKPVKATGGEPCSVEQANLTNAQAKLDWFAQRFATETTAVAKSKKAVASAKKSSKARAQKALVAAKADLAQATRDRQAQLGRVAAATAALEACQAGTPSSNPTTDPTDVPTDVPTDSATD
ncbi:MAG: hypothetical protein ACXVDH_02520, partial [Nocardioides sp.]